MIRLLTISVLSVAALLIADAREADAWVIMGVLPKGEVPEQHCSKSLSDALKKVPYLYRVSLSWNQLVDMAAVTPSPQPTVIAITVFAAGGIEPDKLRIPDQAICNFITESAGAVDQ